MATHGGRASVRLVCEASAPTRGGARRVDVGSRKQRCDWVVGRVDDASAVDWLLPQRGEPILIVVPYVRVHGHRVALSSLRSG
jgi:hypothetical protein